MLVVTVAQVEEAMGCPAAEWVARCYEVACCVTDANLVPGRAVYGHWTGDVNPQSHFAGRRGLPFVRHGWVVTDNEGTVLDPTRWVFEACAPYIFTGTPQPGEAWPYDEAGDAWRASLQRFVPSRVRGEDYADVELTTAVLRRLDLPVRLTVGQAVWVANLPMSVLGKDARDVYLALADAGFKAMVPLDNWLREVGQ